MSAASVTHGQICAPAARKKLAPTHSFFEHEINVGHSFLFSPKLLNQLHFLVGHCDNQTHSLNENPQITVSGTGGGAQADARRTEYHLDATDIVTYSGSRQEIKFGIDVPDISRRAYDDFTNQSGTYSFASLGDYAANRPFQPPRRMQVDLEFKF